MERKRIPKQDIPEVSECTKLFLPEERGIKKTFKIRLIHSIKMVNGTRDDTIAV
jgi:hypothetical protein